MGKGVEVDLAQLPPATVVAFGTQSMRVKGTDGEEYAVVTLDLQFQPEPGKVFQQTFMLHKEDARSLRDALKNPQQVSTDPKEDQTT